MQAEAKQMSIADPILMEIDQEAATTRRILERVPEDKLTWKPHPKSMSLGQLALHIAMTQGAVAEMTLADSVEPPAFEQPEAKSRAEILEAFEASTLKAKEVLGGTDNERAMATWSMLKDGKPLMEIPRVGVWRAILLNHLYHHRGQLSVYLRELDVPVPSIYGPSADENPFG